MSLHLGLLAVIFTIILAVVLTVILTKPRHLPLVYFSGDVIFKVPYPYITLPKSRPSPNFFSFHHSSGVNIYEKITTNTRCFMHNTHRLCVFCYVA